MMNEKTKQEQQLKTQIVNVSGSKFEVSANTWETIENNVPKHLQHDINYQQTEVIVERHAVSFTAILYYYQGRDLHLPTNVCPAIFQRELEFWGIDPTCLSKCCFAKYVSHFDDQEALKILEKDEIHKVAEHENLMSLAAKGGWTAVQANVWLVLNEPFYSTKAKIYFGVSLVIILMSLFALIAGTHEQFQRPLKVSEWEIYFGDEWVDYKHHFISSPEPETEAEPETTSEPETEPEATGEPETEPETTAKPETEPEATGEPETEPETTAEPETEPEGTDKPSPVPEGTFVRYDYLEYIEYVCVLFFTFDLIVRFIFCPSKFDLLVSVLNWVDIFALAIMYIRYIVEACIPKEKYHASILDQLHVLQIVRVFRLIRLVKHFVGFRVLYYAFVASFKEMMLLMMFLNFAMMMFSAFAFFSGDESFPSIPDACWWAIVTMTTVGYGDVVPTLAISKVIGAFCALSGVALIAVIIPIFVNNFVLFYSYSKVWGKKYDRDRKKGSEKVTPVMTINNTHNNNQSINYIDLDKTNSNV